MRRDLRFGDKWSVPECFPWVDRLFGLDHIWHSLDDLAAPPVVDVSRINR